MARSCSIRGASSSQPLPSSSILIGTTTCNARPSSAGIGPRILPVTSSTPANRLVSAATLAWSAGVMGPSGRSYTTSAGKMSLGVNCLASSTTWVDSAFWGSQAEESFCWALFSLPASGPATATTTIQKARTTHLVQRPHGRAAIRRAAPMLPARFGASSPPAAVRPAAFRKLPEIPIVRPPIAFRRQAFQAVPRCARERLGHGAVVLHRSTATSAADAGSRRAFGQEPRRPPGHLRCRIPDHGRAVIRTRGLVEGNARSSPEASSAGVVAPVDLQASHRSASLSFSGVEVGRGRLGCCPDHWLAVAPSTAGTYPPGGDQVEPGQSGRLTEPLAQADGFDGWGHGRLLPSSALISRCVAPEAISIS